MAGSEPGPIGQGIGDAVGGVLQGVGATIAQHNALPPREKNLARARRGIWLITACLYVAGFIILISWHDIGTLGRLVWAAAIHPNSDGTPMLAIWAGLLGFGVLWFAVGVRGSRGPRDAMMTFWAIVRACIWAALLWWGAYLTVDEPGNWQALANVAIKGIYIASLVANVALVLLLLRGPGVAAHRVVAQHIETTTVSWRPARRRFWRKA